MGFSSSAHYQSHQLSQREIDTEVLLCRFVLPFLCGGYVYVETLLDYGVKRVPGTNVFPQQILCLPPPSLRGRLITFGAILIILVTF
jgi:hypothetical protein